MIYAILAAASVLAGLYLRGLVLYERRVDYPGGKTLTVHLTPETTNERAQWWWRARVWALPLVGMEIGAMITKLIRPLVQFVVRPAKQRRLDRMRRQILRKRRAELIDPAVLGRQSETAALDLYPSLERLTQLARTPNSELAKTPQTLVEMGAHVQALERAGISTDALVARETPPIGLLGRIGHAAGGAIGLTPYGRIWTALKLFFRALPWILSAVFFGFWQGALATGARVAAKVEALRSTNSSLGQALEASQRANTALQARALQAEDLARRQAQSVQDAQDLAARSQAAGARRAAARAQIAKNAQKSVEKINNETSDNPLSFDGTRWVRERSDRARGLAGDAAPVPDLPDTESPNPGTGVLPGG